MLYDDVSDQTARALQFRVARAQRAGRVPSVVASVARRGEPVWFGAAGTVDGQAPTEDMQYRIGSITKTMVAVLVMRLVERGEIGIDDELRRYLPDAPAGDSTIYQLLTHTAGLASETPPPWWERTAGTHRPELADVLPADPRRHAAGHLFHYSNPGFGLLGALVAHLAGRPWFDELAEHVLTPLRMTRTDYQPTVPHARGWAVHPWADVLLPEPGHDHGLLAAAGQIWATPGDLCRFGVFLGGRGDGVLAESTLEKMRLPTTRPEPESWSNSYGLGVQILRYGERTAFGHTGSMPGFVAIMLTSHDDALTVAVQSNAWGDLGLREIAGELFDVLRAHEPTMPEPWVPAREVDAAAYELVGPWYWGAVATAISLRADGDLHLAGIGSGGRAARFTRVDDGRWIGRDGYYLGEYLEVRRDAAGVITHLDLGSFVFTRAPYAPADVIPDGLELGDWQV